MGFPGAFGRARWAAGFGIAGLLVVGCSAAVSGSAVRDSTAAAPAATTQGQDWSTAEPPTTTASPPARSTTAGHTAPSGSAATRASSTGRPAGDLGLTEMI